MKPSAGCTFTLISNSKQPGFISCSLLFQILVCLAKPERSASPWGAGPSFLMLIKSRVPALEVQWVGKSVRAVLQLYEMFKNNGKYWFAEGELWMRIQWARESFFLSSCLVGAWSFVKKFATVWCTHCRIKDKLWYYFFRTISLFFESLLSKKSQGFFHSVSESSLSSIRHCWPFSGVRFSEVLPL